MSAQTKVKVITEGADLLQASGQRSSFAVDYRWNDDASFYSSTADILADVFTVVSYDRRSNSRSAGDQTTDMTVAQQARDAQLLSKQWETTKLLFLEVAEAALSVLSWQQPNRKSLTFSSFTSLR